MKTKTKNEYWKLQNESIQTYANHRMNQHLFQIKLRDIMRIEYAEPSDQHAFTIKTLSKSYFCGFSMKINMRMYLMAKSFYNILKIVHLPFSSCKLR